MKAYSVDLRQKIVEAVRKRGLSKAQAARSFGVSLSSVKRYTKLSDEGKNLSPKKRPGRAAKLDERGTKLLEEDLASRPEATHRQRAKFLFVMLGVRLSEATICRTIRRLSHTRKKDPGSLQKETSSSDVLGG